VKLTLSLAVDEGHGLSLAETLLAGGGAVLHLAGNLRAEEWNGVVNPGFIIADAALA